MKNTSLLGLLVLMIFLLFGAFYWKQSVTENTVNGVKNITEEVPQKNLTKEWMNMSDLDGELLYKFDMPRETYLNTNFSGAKFTVGRSFDPKAIDSCVLKRDGEEMGESKVNINGVDYAVFNYADAGAGNFYDTTSYRAVYNGACYAMEYTIHSTNIHNYSPDQGVKEFDVKSVKEILDNMVKNFK